MLTSLVITRLRLRLSLKPKLTSSLSSLIGMLLFLELKTLTLLDPFSVILLTRQLLPSKQLGQDRVKMARVLLKPSSRGPTSQQRLPEQAPHMYVCIFMNVALCWAHD
jgi:hypothetical protein